MGILSLFRRTKKAAAGVPADSVARAQPGSTAPAPSSAVRPPTDGRARVVLPHLTEKATRLGAEGRYTFRVDQGATKPEIRTTVERQYGVHVTAVAVMSVRGKPRRRGRIVGRSTGYRKAVVTLREGERIDLTGSKR